MKLSDDLMKLDTHWKWFAVTMKRNDILWHSQQASHCINYQWEWRILLIDTASAQTGCWPGTQSDVKTKMLPTSAQQPGPEFQQLKNWWAVRLQPLFSTSSCFWSRITVFVLIFTFALCCWLCIILWRRSGNLVSIFQEKIFIFFVKDGTFQKLLVT